MPTQHRDFTLVDFPGRRLTVGSPDHTAREQPPHEVEIGPYRLADRCVSAGDFHAFLRDAPHRADHLLIDCLDPCFVVHRADGFALRPGCARYPMIQISYRGAAAYCDWLSRTEGLRPVYGGPSRTGTADRDGYRLPTEAEWEAACREGHPASTAPDPDDCNSGAAGPRCRRLRAGEHAAGAFLPGRPAPVPVASLPPDAAGLFEMLGNVREWCHDRYGPYGPGPLRDPRGAPRGAFRVVRGGSFADPPEACAPARRMAAHEDTRCEVYGFRVARSR
ncbi:SUMF1/EgtB/PvdO family nonheme iron enzyme [Streptomyces sp. F63]|uniref:formylglycine-generating enzyme family protein n=1 Tax=Streptomyces sp. F63 TaxID=2824887 RepID=UPI001B35F75C|nr:SUMF1/EgtB/PvdO family nonheme iron enzyme [Streptomyces sp. F63]MBQ0984723.1 SUMF1/EgtB/PvdO family nonheme iron enzyme [Streptomyces sp. F63]